MDLMNETAGLQRIALAIARRVHHHATHMKPTEKKQWVKPVMKDVPIFFECTCYAAAV